VIHLVIQSIFNEIEKQRDEMTQTLIDLIRIPAIGPESGGEGEIWKSERLVQICKTIGFDEVQNYDASDARVPSKKRPNLVAFLKGETDKERLWIVTHMDIVPPGEDSLWTIAKPFNPIVKDGKVYGRGTEDNTQPMVSSIFAVKAFKNLGIKPKRTVALCFVADEESGSKYGIQHLIGKGLFRKDDLVIVPDGGNSDGSFIEIAEKSSIWLKIDTIGKQAHASRPSDGLNAHRVGMEFALALDKMLHERYSDQDALFDIPISTFEPTKKDRNIDAINIVPGEDTTYLDGRILPRYDVDEMLKNAASLALEFEKTGAKIRIEVVNKNIAAPPTDARAKIVLMLKEAIKRTREKDVQVGGIGGGTCAAFFRDAGIPAVVWATMDEMAHQPNEYAKIDNMVNDAKVFAYLAGQN
jgi:succinyl-diaminopimelate desuccinylase